MTKDELKTILPALIFSEKDVLEIVGDRMQAVEDQGSIEGIVSDAIDSAINREASAYDKVIYLASSAYEAGFRDALFIVKEAAQETLGE